MKLLWSFMQTGETALKEGVAFEKLDLAAVRVAFGSVKTAAMKLSAEQTKNWTHAIRSGLPRWAR